MKLEVNLTKNNKITFKGKNIYGYTEFTEKLWSKIKDLNFSISDKDLEKGKRTYIYTGSSKAFTSRYRKLYEIVMCSWYGKETVDQMRDSKYIIEHLDNNPHNCSIENLAFAHEDLNKTKAFSFDKDRPSIMNKVGINIFKNFDSGEFEITLAFTEVYYLKYEEEGKEKAIPLTDFHFKYKNDFRTVLMDANSLVTKIKNDSTIFLPALECYDYGYTKANFVISPEEKDINDLPPILFHNDTPYVVLNKHTRLLKVGPSWRRKNKNTNLIKMEQ